MDANEALGLTRQASADADEVSQTLSGIGTTIDSMAGVHGIEEWANEFAAELAARGVHESTQSMLSQAAELAKEAVPMMAAVKTEAEQTSSTTQQLYDKLSELQQLLGQISEQ